MVRRNPILRLALGWLLMLAGALLLMDSGIRYRPDGSRLPVVESLAGFAAAVAGWWLRRTAVAKAARPENDSGEA